MNAPIWPEVLTRRDTPAAAEQAPLPLATEGVQRHVWQSRYGDILIEVEGESIRVNGQPVERVASGPGSVR